MAEKDSGSKKTVVKAAPVAVKAKVIFRPDMKETARLVKAGHTATANAIRASRALGLAITYLENGILYKEFPDGRKENIKSGKVKRTIPRRKDVSLKKGMVLYAKK